MLNKSLKTDSNTRTLRMKIDILFNFHDKSGVLRRSDETRKDEAFITCPVLLRNR